MHPCNVRKGGSNRAAQVLTMTFRERFMKETFVSVQKPQTFKETDRKLSSGQGKTH